MVFGALTMGYKKVTTLNFPSLLKAEMFPEEPIGVFGWYFTQCRDSSLNRLMMMLYLFFFFFNQFLNVDKERKYQEEDEPHTLWEPCFPNFIGHKKQAICYKCIQVNWIFLAWIFFMKKSTVLLIKAPELFFYISARVVYCKGFRVSRKSGLSVFPKPVSCGGNTLWLHLMALPGLWFKL